MTKVLLVDIDTARRRTLHEALVRHGLEVIETSNLLSASQLVCDAHVIASHAELDGARGIDLRVTSPHTPLVLYAEHASVRCAVEAMQRGASDYLAIPFDPIELVNSIMRSVAGVASRTHAQGQVDGTAPIIGSCTAMQTLREQICQVAQRETSALICGEPGTGKEIVARSIHAASARHRRPMIVVNCATMPAALVESDLFGSEPGRSPDTQHAPDGALRMANHGTLFLDELSALSSAGQARLLHLLQRSDQDVMVIGASHRDLHQLVRSGDFDAALYEHLATTTLVVPPLRERDDDIVDLAQTLLQRTCAKLSKPDLKLSDAAIAAIREYQWPGNVRELENALERAVILCETLVIEPPMLAIPAVATAPAEVETASKRDEMPGDMSLEGYFVSFVLEHQDACTETELANRLGISRKSLWERRQRLNIPRKRHRGAGT
jgi:DNA-binding NtrC family response regulator